MSKHTPGTWFVSNRDESGYGYIAHLTNGTNPIADVFRADGNGHHNARLLAAAPDLLAACKDAVTELHEFVNECIDDPNESEYRIIRAIEAVIAKAEGSPIHRPTQETGNAE